MSNGGEWTNAQEKELQELLEELEKSKGVPAGTVNAAKKEARALSKMANTAQAKEATRFSRFADAVFDIILDFSERLEKPYTEGILFSKRSVNLKAENAPLFNRCFERVFIAIDRLKETMRQEGGRAEENFLDALLNVYHELSKQQYTKGLCGKFTRATTSKTFTRKITALEREQVYFSAMLQEMKIKRELPMYMEFLKAVADMKNKEARRREEDIQRLEDRLAKIRRMGGGGRASRRRRRTRRRL